MKHIDALHKKLVSVTSRIFSVEQLCLVKKEIDSLRSTAKVFKQFAPIERVEALTYNIKEQLDKVLDIEELLSTTTNDLDVEEDLLLIEQEIDQDTLNTIKQPHTLPNITMNTVLENLIIDEGADEEDTMLMQAV